MTGSAPSLVFRLFFDRMSDHAAAAETKHTTEGRVGG